MNVATCSVVAIRGNSAAIQVPERVEERLLGEVGGQLGVRRVMSEKAEDWILIAFGEDIERATLTVANASDQRLVIQRLQRGESVSGDGRHGMLSFATERFPILLIELNAWAIENRTAAWDVAADNSQD